MPDPPHIGSIRLPVFPPYCIVQESQELILMITDECINRTLMKQDTAASGGGLQVENGFPLINDRFTPICVLSMKNVLGIQMLI